MKHIFVIHSNLSYLASLGVICKENIPMNDVIIIGNDYQNNWGPIEIHSIKFKRLKDFFKHPIKTIAPVYSIDKFIKKICKNENYIAYVDAVTPLQQIIITNSKCINYHYVEEGLSVYRERIYFQSLVDNFPSKRPYRNNTLKYILSDIFLVIKGFSFKMQALPYIYNACFNCIDKKCYGFNKDSFYQTKNLELISLKQISESFLWPKKYNLDNSHIWLGSPITNFHNIPLNSYIYGIEQTCLNYLLQNNIDKINIKFHPKETEESKQHTINLFINKNIEVEILSDDLFIEIELLSTNNATLWSVDTSIFLYASEMGHKCYSITNHIKDYNVNISHLSTYYKKINIV